MTQYFFYLFHAIFHKIWLHSKNNYKIWVYSFILQYMAEIFEFPGTKERLQQIHKEESLQWLENLVEAGLKETPQRVNELLSTPLNQIVTLSPEEMRNVMFDFFLHKLELSRAKLTLDVIQATQYLSDLLLKLWVVMDKETEETLQNPYYSYWLERESPKRAWDASVFNLVFPKSRKVFLTPEEYMFFALNGYSFYFGKNFAWWMSKVLPFAQNFTHENPFFRRSFEIVNAK